MKTKVIKFRECEYRIDTDGTTMIEIFGISPDIVKNIKLIAKRTRSLKLTIEKLKMNNQYLDLLILLVSIWSSIPLEDSKKRNKK